MIWIVGIALVVAAYLYKKVVLPHSYWKKKGVKQGYQALLLGDNWGTITREHSLADLVDYVYNKFPEERYSGMYQFLTPILVIRDPELIRQIAVKDFDHFTDHLRLIAEGQDPLFSKNLFSLEGDRWRCMRATLSPAFTSSKMKAMFELMSQCSKQFTGHFLKKGEDVVDVELKDIFTRYANDVIASCAFGVDCDSLAHQDNEFYQMGKEVTDVTSFWKGLKILIYFLFPKICKLLQISFFSKQVTKFFRRLMRDSVKMREDKNVMRPDMIHLLMEARKGKLKYEEQQAGSKEAGFAPGDESSVGTLKLAEEEITLDDITAQALIFFFAGFETVSVLMCFMGHELSINCNIQERLREEVDETMRSCNGKLTYDALNKMKYLDMVVAETLRKWPGGAAIDRVCTIPYTIQPKTPSEVPVELKKGDCVWFPTWGLHHDPKYFPNPDRFDPERFSEENKGNIKPYTYLPFGLGPRNCIGSRFALLEAKAIFVNLLSKFEIVVTQKTQVPLKLSKLGVNIGSEKGFHLGLKKRII